MKRLFIILLTGLLLLNSLYMFCPEDTQGAICIEHQAEADALCFLGVFSGTQKGFELERIPTRAEGAVMLVRLLGQEDYALQAGLTHPFRDVPSWADPYIAYLYQKGLTTGTNTNSFSPYAALSVEQYMSFILRTLAYSESQGDFTWNESLDKAWQLGILNTNAYNQLNSSQFRRDHMVWISYLALQSKLKNQDYTLLEKLVQEDQVISTAAAEASGLYANGASRFPPQLIRSSGNYSAANTRQLQVVLETALLNMEPKFKINANNYTDGDPLDDFEAALEAAQKSLEAKIGTAQVYKNGHCLYNENELEVSIEYCAQYLALRKKAKEIVNELIQSSMSDYEKEKALHDYIINNAEYDFDNFQAGSIPASSYTAYGILILGRGVCEGYAKAMQMLCSEAGLNSMVVYGTSLYKGKWYNHAWNIVKVDNQYYQLDVCWDDEIEPGGSGALSYAYYNLNDLDMYKDHHWDKLQYPSCTATQYNYYVYNELQVQNFQGFKTYLNNALAEEPSEFTVRVADFNRSDYADLKSLLSSNKVHRYTYNINDGLGIISIYNITYN